MDAIRILLLADSHLGFDLPTGPRVRRRRRGDDFLANYARALEPALAGRVDLVVHGGDVFDRPVVPSSLGYQAFEPLVRVAERGVPVFLVPGNHERSRFPHIRFAAHAAIHVFDRPRTFCVEVRGERVALSGFPNERRDVRSRFADLVEGTGWRDAGCAVHLLCMHQCIEGATVGPGDFTFTTAADVVRGRDLPGGFGAVLSGHIHRHQVLAEDLRGHPLAAPVLYPGSIERTSLAEQSEPKGFMTIEAGPGPPGGSLRWTFHPLPARPMIVHDLAVDALGPDALDLALRAMIAAVPADAVLRIRISGTPPAASRRLLSATRLRVLAPSTMNIEITGDIVPRRVRSRRPDPLRTAELELPLGRT